MSVLDDVYTGDVADGDDALAEEKPVPHYQLPNFASILPEYSNVEQDYIKSAFERCNFKSIAGMPNRIRPGETQKAIQRRVDGNLKSSFVSGPKVGKKTKNGLFSEFAYVPSRYSLADELKRKERLEKEAHRLEVGGRDWAVNSNRRKLKYEDGFENKEYTYPYMGDAFEASQDQDLRKKWIDETKVLHGPFRPSGVEKSLAKPSRQGLDKLLKDIRRAMQDDWEPEAFDVISTEDESIIVRFEMISLVSESAVLAYMNVFLRSSIVSEYLLRKVVEDWCKKPGDGFLYFMFRPPWVKARTVDAYLALHPEERSYKTSRNAQLLGGAKGESKEALE